MYNRTKAVSYAHKWWNKRNPSYYDFDDLGGDCTNFVSQVLHAGGIQMDDRFNGWFYYSLSVRSSSWTGVDELYDYIINNDSTNGPRAKIVSLEEVSLGDIIQLKLSNNDYQHSVVVTKIDYPRSASTTYVTCHTFDARDKRLSDYHAREIRCLKILN